MRALHVGAEDGMSAQMPNRNSSYALVLFCPRIWTPQTGRKNVDGYRLG